MLKNPTGRSDSIQRLGFSGAVEKKTSHFEVLRYSPRIFRVLDMASTGAVPGLFSESPLI